MPRLNKEEFYTRVTGFIGDNPSDEAISFLEDMTDTFTALEGEVNGDGIDWKAKYHENDEAWRKKYYNRFMGGNSGEVEFTDSVKMQPKVIDFDDVFED